MKTINPNDVIDFWFIECDSKKRFQKDSDFDNLIKERFSKTLDAAGKGELWQWRNSAHGWLAEIIVLDQFPRNIYRGDKKSFLYDPLALVLAQQAIAAKVDKELIPSKRAFLYMPFMHSESSIIHEQAIKLFLQAGLENHLQHEVRHKKVIDRFGRYPHRNKILGRDSSAEEVSFLAKPGSRF